MFTSCLEKQGMLLKHTKFVPESNSFLKPREHIRVLEDQIYKKERLINGMASTIYIKGTLKPSTEFANPKTQSNPKTAKCAVCSVEFKKVANQKYCSPACNPRPRTKPNRRTGRKHTKCAQCRNVITAPKHHKYCSTECRRKYHTVELSKKYHSEKPVRKCMNCKRTIKLPKRQKYCTNECRSDYWWEAAKDKYHAGQPTGIPCLGCSKPMSKPGGRQVCSKECKVLWIEKRKERSIRKCQRCNAIITARRFHAYCTHECRLAHYDECRRARIRAKVTYTGMCGHCGIAVTDPKRRRYCSDECMINRVKAVRMAEREALRPKIKNCLRCGKPIPKHWHKYCSESCRVVFYANRQLKRIAIKNRRAELIRKGEEEERLREEKEREESVA